MKDKIEINEGTNATTESKDNSKKSKSPKRNSKDEKLQKLKDASLKDREISSTVGRYKRPNNMDEVVELSKSQPMVISKPLSKSQPRIWPGSIDNLPSPEGSKPFPLQKSKSKSGSSLFVIKKNITSNEDKGGKSKKKKGRWKSLLSVAWFSGKQDKDKNEKSKFGTAQTTEESGSFIFKPNESAENKPTTPSSITPDITEIDSSEDTSKITHSASQELSENIKGNDLEVSAENKESKQNNINLKQKEKKKDIYNVKTPTEIYNDSRKEGKQDTKATISESNKEDTLVNKQYDVITPSEILANKTSVTSASVTNDHIFRFDSPNIHRKDQERRKARLFPNMNQINHSQSNIKSQSGDENLQPTYQNDPPNRLVNTNVDQQNYAHVQDNVYSYTKPYPQGYLEQNINLPRKQIIYGANNDTVPYMNNMQRRPLPPRPPIINQSNRGPYIQEDIYGINPYYPKHHENDSLYSTGTYNKNISQTLAMRKGRDHLNLPLQNPLVSSQNEEYFQRSNSLNYRKQVYAQPSVPLNNNQTQIYINNVVPIHHPVNHSSSDATFQQQQLALYKQRANDLQVAAVHNGKYQTYQQPNYPRQRSVTVGNEIREPTYANNMPQKERLAMTINRSDSLYVQKNNETHVRPFKDNDSKPSLSLQTVNQMKNNPNLHQHQHFPYQVVQTAPRDNHVRRSHSSVGYSGISDSEYIQFLRNQDHHNYSINNQPIYGYSGGQYKSNIVQPGGYGVQKRINMYKEPPANDIYNTSYNQKSHPRHAGRTGIPVRRSHSYAFPTKNVYQVQANSRADLAGHQSPTIHRVLGLNKSDLHIRRSKSMAYQNARHLQQDTNRLNTPQYVQNPSMHMNNYSINDIQGNPYQNGDHFEGFDEIDRFRSLSLHNSAMNTPLSRSRTSLSQKEDNDHLHSLLNYARIESYQQDPSFNKTALINTAKYVQNNSQQNTRQASSLKEAYDNQNLHIQKAQQLEVEPDGSNIRKNKNITNTNNIDNEHMSLSLQNSISSNQTINENRHKTISAQNSTSSIQSESSQPMIDNHLDKHKVMLFKEFGVDMNGLINNLDSEDNSISGPNDTRDGSKPMISSKTLEIKTSTEINTETENETEPAKNINQEENKVALNDSKIILTSSTTNKNRIRHVEPPSSL